MKNSLKLLEKIKSRNINPTARWKFILQNTFSWGAFFISVILGGLAFSVIIFSFSQEEVILFSHFSHSKIEFFLGILPFLWIIFVFLFFIFSYFLLRHTKRGYRYPLFIVLGGSISISILVGIVLFFNGGAEKFEKIFSQKIHLYEGIDEKKEKFWISPEKGFLSGQIISLNINDEESEERRLEIRDFQGNEWRILYKENSVRQKVLLEKNEKIKIIGETTAENIFSAKEIRPWNGSEQRKYQ